MRSSASARENWTSSRPTSERHVWPGQERWRTAGRSPDGTSERPVRFLVACTNAVHARYAARQNGTSTALARLSTLIRSPIERWSHGAMPRPGMTRGRRCPFLSVPTAVIPSASIRATGRFVTPTRAVSRPTRTARSGLVAATVRADTSSRHTLAEQATCRLVHRSRRRGRRAAPVVGQPQHQLGNWIVMPSLTMPLQVSYHSRLSVSGR
jgi:hypothetical protein